MDFVQMEVAHACIFGEWRRDSLGDISLMRSARPQVPCCYRSSLASSPRIFTVAGSYFFLITHIMLIANFILFFFQ